MPAATRTLTRLGLAGVLLLGGFAAGAATADRPAHPGPPSPTGDPSSLDDAGRSSAGRPAGSSDVRTRRGAVDAATRAVALLGEPQALEPSGRARVLTALAADQARPALAARLAVPPAVEDATGLGADLAADRPVVARAVPVASRLLAYTGDAATVEVWVVAVLGTGRLGVLTSSWSTETLRLVWQRRAWRIAGYASRSGPVPAATQPPTAFSDAIGASSGTGGNRAAG